MQCVLLVCDVYTYVTYFQRSCKFQFLLSTFQNLLLNSVLTYQKNYLYLSVEREREREEREGGREREVGREGNHRHRNMMSCGKGVLMHV